MKTNLILLLLICISVTSYAQDTDDKITYRWLNGRNAGQPSRSYDYKSKKIDTDIFLVNWHESEENNFVSMVYNFRSNSCLASVISKYGEEKPFLNFQSGVIEQVTIER